MDYISEIKNIITALGYKLVEVQQSRVKGGLKFVIFIYKNDGIGSDDCDIVSKALIARLEALSEGLDVVMEVSSPGIDRVFKNREEYGIFEGKLVQANFHDGRVAKGLLNKVTEQGVNIDDHTYHYEDIAKCKLI